MNLLSGEGRGAPEGL